MPSVEPWRAALWSSFRGPRGHCCCTEGMVAIDRCRCRSRLSCRPSRLVTSNHVRVGGPYPLSDELGVRRHLAKGVTEQHPDTARGATTSVIAEPVSTRWTSILHDSWISLGNLGLARSWVVALTLLLLQLRKQCLAPDYCNKNIGTARSRSSSRGDISRRGRGRDRTSPTGSA